MRELSKDKCQMYHTFKRFKERLGIKLDENAYNQIISIIKNNKEHPSIKVTFLEKQSKRVSHYKLEYEGKTINIAYDTIRNQIITLLFPEDNIQRIYHFIDVFGNKVSTKDYSGYIWKVKDGILDIPGETLVKDGEFWRIVDGVYKDRIFKFEENILVEVM